MQIQKAQKSPQNYHWLALPDEIHLISSSYSCLAITRTFKGNRKRFELSGVQVRGGEATMPGTEKRCSHNLPSNPLGSSFKKGQEHFPL